MNHRAEFQVLDFARRNHKPDALSPSLDPDTGKPYANPEDEPFTGLRLILGWTIGAVVGWSILALAGWALFWLASAARAYW